MALVGTGVAAVGVIDALIIGYGGTITGIALFANTYQHIKKYFESGKVIDLIPSSDVESKSLVERTGVGDLTAMDVVLVGSNALGILLLLNPQFRLVGGLTLLASFISTTTRDNAKLIGVASSALAVSISNPVGAAKTALGLLGVAANVTASNLSSAVQLSTTVIGVVVTVSGAVVGYILTRRNK
jgi:hypothetical protein